MSGEQHTPDCTRWQCAPGCDVTTARVAERFGPFIEPLRAAGGEVIDPKAAFASIAVNGSQRGEVFTLTDAKPAKRCADCGQLAATEEHDDTLCARAKVLFPPAAEAPIAEPTSMPLRWVTCVSCGQTFAAREYPPKQCTACGVHFERKVLTKVGDTIESVQKRNARKQLRKGKRK